MQNNFSSCFMFSSFLLFLIGCHNNAHIRTQKPLELGETVYSASATLPVTLPEPDRSNGIIGMRAEGSVLYGITNNGEIGAYAALGLGEREPGAVLGFDYKKQLSIMGAPLTKVGGRFELNISDEGTFFNSRPSITTTTSKNKPMYFGVHGLFSQGGPSPDRGLKILSTGAGLTVGSELFFKSSSLQTQLDISFVHDNYIYENYNSWYDNYRVESDYFIISPSIAWNFFRPTSRANPPFDPPPPVQEKEIKPPHNIVPKSSTKLFDPETGKKIRKKEMFFDPKTGERINKKSQKYDPETGEFLTQETENETIIKKQVAVEKQNNNVEKLSYSQIIYLAKEEAKNSHIGIPWGFCGLAGFGTGGAGGLAGGFFAYELIDSDAFFPGLLVGGILGFSIPPVLAGLTAQAVRIEYPKNIKTPTEKIQYKKTFIKETKKLRTRSAWTGTVLGGMVGGMSFLLLLSTVF